MNLREQAVDIVRTLRAGGYQAYLVGGCVRDLLLEREPADYDVATDATPEEVMRIFPRTWAVGAQFGVVLVPVAGPEPADEETPNKQQRAIEVATFRSDGLYTDGRHPDEVRYTRLPEEDVRRRDFTINGLLLDPLSGQVLDFVEGRQDLQGRIIRTIGDPRLRFAEDKLRLLRAVRFAARFGYTIESRTLDAIRELGPQIQAVSRERIPARARWPGAPCCTMWASRRRIAWLRTASALTGTWKWGKPWPGRSAGDSACPTTIRTRLSRWWSITCASPTLRK
jgi:poly(A) polymerase